MNRRVLIVNPNFPPINSPDHQRIRMSLPYFFEFGWDVTVLCVNPDLMEGIREPNLVLTIPENIEIIYSSAISYKLSRKIGLGNIAFRCLPFLVRETKKYFEKNYFDLVYFSNTAFLTMVLGRYWFAKYKVPYILDFQDPWLSDYYDRTNTKPPGGKLKYAIAQSFAKVLEPFTLRKASHITSVSPEYPKMLKQRYPWLTENQFTVLPFGAPEKDFELLTKLNIEQKIFNPNDGYQHWVYVGRGGDDMAFSLNSLFDVIQKHRQHNPDLWQKIKIHFIGTKYSTFDHDKPIEAIAKSYNLEDIVTEYPQRIPYFEALQVLSNSNAILIIGSDDQAYSASKIYPCILARKPILAILHEKSFVVNVIRECSAGHIATFTDILSNNKEVLHDIQQAIDRLHDSIAHPSSETTDWRAFEHYTARRMTQVLCVIFNQLIHLKQNKA